MPEYRVRWEIDIEADNPVEAAAYALSVQRDPNSIATVFEVVERSWEPTDGYIDIDVRTIDLSKGAS